MRVSEAMTREVRVCNSGQSIGDCAMSRQVLFCFDDQDLDHIARSMGEARVRRLPVIDRDSNLVGILSVSDLALRHAPAAAADAVARLSRRGGPHSQIKG
jgi:CBS domain-containing protein